MHPFADVLTGQVGPKAHAPATCPSQPVAAASRQGAKPEASLASESKIVDHAAHTLLGMLQNDEPMAPRMTHKEVEQHRRMQAKRFFDELRVLVPGGAEQKHDRNKLLAMSIQYVRSLKHGGNPQPIEAGDGEERVGSSPSCDMMFEMEDLSKKDQAEKRLSHNEVEQRRRLQAKKHYEELRSLLPNSAKFDKNTLLEHAIAYIKKATGVMDEEHGGASGDGESETAYSRTPSTVAGAGTHGSWQESMLSGSFSSLASIATTSSPSAVNNLSSSLNSSGRGRKRTPSKSMLEAESFSASILSRSAPSVTNKQQTFDQGHNEGPISEQKKRRTLDGSAELLAAIALASSPPQTSDSDTEMCLDALSLLSHCAVQLSEPNTPAMAPAAQGEIPGNFSLSLVA